MASFLPGVAYHRVRDNRSTINIKTGYEKKAVAAQIQFLFIPDYNIAQMVHDLFMHCFRDEDNRGICDKYRLLSLMLWTDVLLL